MKNYDWVEKYLNLPYEDKGRTLEGIDCWGLTRLVLIEVFGKKSVPLLDGYCSSFTPGKYLEENWIDWKIIPLGEEQPGDVLAFRIKGQVTHTAIVIKPTSALHILEGRSSCIIDYNYQPYKNMLERIGRWPGN